jgi:SSS family solute:Na+ symporter
MSFSTLDIIVFLFYCAILILVGGYLSQKNKSESDLGAADNYFFAGKSLPWYLIGTSILAANISAEQFIGMSGSGYAMGLTIATYEWIASIILLLVAIFFLPVFIRSGISTMPQFLEKRYSSGIKNSLAIFWLSLFVFVNLTSILYLGALALQAIFGIGLEWAVWGLAIFSAVYAVAGGLKVIASADIIQVVFLIGGGLLTTFLALNAISGGDGIIKGFELMLEKAPEKFHMILSKSDPNYKYMPGIRSIFGGIWIAAIYYFGANQYIIQKGLSAKNLNEAQKGLAFAGILKLLVPIIVVIPGIAAFVLNAEISKPDEAYPWLLNHLIPSGVKGLMFAALIAAIVSSLGAIVNSASTIFVLDIYKAGVNANAPDKRLVLLGRISGIIFLSVAAGLASFLKGFDQVFQFIQEYTGMISPGITAIFIFGMFWKKTTTRAAWVAVIASLPVSLFNKFALPKILSIGELPFLDNMMISFFVISLLIVLVSLTESNPKIKPITFDAKYFSVKKDFTYMAIFIIVVFVSLYLIFW